jgi:enoyl-CoA hydratase
MLATEHRDGVTILRLEHGPVNALDLELLRALTGAVAETAGPLVLVGAGRCFSAGVDLRRIVDEETSYSSSFLAALSEAFLAVFDHPSPTVAAVNGHALAGGCILALACDARLMAAGRIGLIELAVGVPFPAAALEIARHALGPAASRVLLRADTVDPPEALRLGIIDEVIAGDELLPRAVSLTSTMAGHDAAAYGAVKRGLHRPVRDALNAGNDQEVVDMWTTPETRNRLAAQLAKLSRH